LINYSLYSPINWLTMIWHKQVFVFFDAVQEM